MTKSERVQLYLLGIAVGSALSAGSAKLAYPWLPEAVPLMFAWISGAAWTAIFFVRSR